MAMTDEERERLHQLCSLIEAEKDHAKFLRLIRELNELLARTEHRLERRQETQKL